MAQVPGLDPRDIADVIVGCAMPEAEQGMNVARIGVLLAGLPDSVPAMTINRFCSSGVQAVALAADRIRTGDDDVVIAAGTESMSMVPMMGNKIALNDAVFAGNEHVAIAYGMGITAEKVAAAVEGFARGPGRVRRGEPPEGREGHRRGRLPGRDPALRDRDRRPGPRARRPSRKASASPTPTRARGPIPAVETLAQAEDRVRRARLA